jgi:hypothetical protein
MMRTQIASRLIRIEQNTGARSRRVVVVEKKSLEASGIGAGLSNANTIGIEVIAQNDKDVTPAQVEAAKRFIPYLQQKHHVAPDAVYGHGQVNPGHKEPSEGMTIVDALQDTSQGDRDD